MPRKHLIASQTNKKQQNQAKLWQKLAKEIHAAVKVGGPNPEANPRLKSAIQKALVNNLSRDSINRNINGSNKDNDKLESFEFEAYGPNNLQIIIHALSDNINRVTANLNGYLNKLNGKFSKPNSVKIHFNNMGHIIVAKSPNINLDNIMEITLENKIIDIIEQEDCFEIFTDPQDVFNTVDNLNKSSLKIFNYETKLFPEEKLTSLDDVTKQKLQNFINACENDDDIQWVVTNFYEE